MANKVSPKFTQKVTLLALFPLALVSVSFFLFALKIKNLPISTFESEVISNPLPTYTPEDGYKLYSNKAYDFTAEVPNFSPWVESKIGYYYVANESAVMITPIRGETDLSVVEFLRKKKREVSGALTTILGELPDEPNAVIGGEPAIVLFFPKTPMAQAGFDAYVIHDRKVIKFSCSKPESADSLEVFKHMLSTVRFRELPNSTKLPNILTEYPNYE